MEYLFKHNLGTYLCNEKGKIVETFNEAVPTQHKELQPPPLEIRSKILQQIASQEHFSELRDQGRAWTKEQLQQATTPDQLIAQAISTIEELDKIGNTLSTRLREWYAWHYPELVREIQSHHAFAVAVLKKQRPKNSLGSELEEKDLTSIKHLAEEIISLYALKETQEKYLESTMKIYCPNLLELAGTTLGAKLLELGKGLKRIALLPASTIQLLGAEKALFRHLKTGARSPKYGVLFEHQLVQKARRKDRGKVARALADKLSLCARLDYFKGELKAKSYKQELEQKFL